MRTLAVISVLLVSTVCMADDPCGGIKALIRTVEAGHDVLHNLKTYQAALVRCEKADQATRDAANRELVKPQPSNIPECESKYQDWQDDINAVRAGTDDQHTRLRLPQERKKLDQCIADEDAQEHADEIQQAKEQSDEAERKRQWNAAFYARQAKIAALKRDRRVVADVWSADLCAAKESRAAVLKEIRTEEYYAKVGGGVIDKEKIFDLQNQMRALDERIASTRDSMRHEHVSPRSCRSRNVAELANCIDANDEPTCDDLRLEVLRDQPTQPPPMPPHQESTDEIIKDILSHPLPSTSGVSVVRP